MDRYTRKVTALLLVMALLTGLLGGCTKNKAASAKVNDKLELAVKYLSEQKFAEAILTYQEIIKVDSKNITAYKGLSLAFVMQKKPDEAQQVLQDGLKAVPENTSLKLALAGFMLDKGDTAQAAAIYKELTSQSNASTAAFHAYMYYLTQHGKPAEAITLLEQATAQNPQEYQLRAMLAELYMEVGDRDKALAAINQSLAIEPNQAAAYSLLANLYQGKWDELIRLGQQYVQQNQAKNGNLLTLSGLLGAGKYEDLIKLFGTLDADVKDTPRGRILAAQACTKVGQKEQALTLLKPIMAASLQDAGMLADLASCFLENGDKSNARLLALQGMQSDTAVIQNYAVMYRSYKDEDQGEAQVWAVKYLLASVLSLQDGMAQLVDYGMVVGFVKQSMGETASQKIVSAIMRDQAFAQKMLQSHPDWRSMNSGLYLDVKTGIAYRGVSEKSNNWRPCIVRYHSPAFYAPEAVPADIVANINRNYDGGWTALQQHWLSESPGITQYILAHGGTPQGKIDWVYPVILEGDLPFEDHLKSAGYPIADITFLDM